MINFTFLYYRLNNKVGILFIISEVIYLIFILLSYKIAVCTIQINLYKNFIYFQNDITILYCL